MNDEIKGSKKEKSSMLGIYFRMIKEIFKMIPRECIFYCLANILYAFSIVLTTFAMQHFFDNVAKMAGGASLSKAVISLIGFSVSTVIMEVSNGLSNFHTEYPSPKALNVMYERLYKKASKIKAVEYENPDFLNLINKARQGIEGGFLASLFLLAAMTFYAPYYLFMTIYLRKLSPVLPLILLFVFLPVIAGKVIRFHIFEQVEEEIAPERRKMEYYERAICDRDYFKETRLLGAYPYFIRLFRKARNQTNEKILQAEMKHARLEFSLRLITIGGYVFILGVLIHELLTGKISAGAFAAVFAGVGTMYNMAEEVFGGILQSISRNAAAVHNYQKFMDLPEPKCVSESSKIKPDSSKGISLVNVHFRYPGATKEAIQGITLSIKEGNTIAIVGENGSGKSTLVKLIMGLYEPAEGKVLVGGLDTAKGSGENVREEFSAVFQKYQRYRITLKENVMVSDPRNQDENAFWSACRNADVNINKEALPEGEDTMLSREFGGVELSGGQWQKAATARGLYRGHNMIILDEPTAAIDPIEETKIYHKFARISEGKTSIIVTHRIGAAQIADLIVVLKDGKLDDIGTHQELMQKDGLYAVMYQEQAKWYKNRKQGTIDILF